MNHILLYHVGAHFGIFLLQLKVAYYLGMTVFCRKNSGDVWTTILLCISEASPRIIKGLELSVLKLKDTFLQVLVFMNLDSLDGRKLVSS